MQGRQADVQVALPSAPAQPLEGQRRLYISVSKLNAEALPGGQHEQVHLPRCMAQA